MVTTYGSFPGVQVEVSGGGITAVAVGEEEKLVLFGPASYQNDGDFATPNDGDEDSLELTLTGSPEATESINARREADTTFGEGSELAEAMREALANGTNIDFLYGVAPKRFNVIDETGSSQTGTLSNAPLVEDDVEDESNIENIVVDDADGTSMTVVYDYESPPTTPSAAEHIAVNPLTGEYAADAAPGGANYEFDYKYLDWQSAFQSTQVQNVVADDESAIFAPLTDADSVASLLDDEIDPDNDGLRSTYQLVNAISGAQPNANENVTSDGQAIAADYSNYTGRDARFDTSTFTTSSVDSDYYFQFAPVRVEDSPFTIIGAIGGLFSSNPLNDPIYNDTVSQLDGNDLEQSFTKSEADNMRAEKVIPIRQAGSIRVKDNLSTSTETDWERDFWRRRIADRVILIAKNVGDTILGQINDEQTRNAAARLIRAELRELVDSRLLEPNTGSETNWFVDVYPDSGNVNEVNIDIGFTPLGIVKRVDTSITINT